MKHWIGLQPGDTIDLILPGYGTTPEKLEKAASLISAMGFIPRMPKDILGEDIFCSGSDEARFRHLQDALLNSESKAIWAVRGGYGAMRLTDRLFQLEAPEKSKLLIGFSDITVLHLFLGQEWGWPTLHGRVLVQLVDKVLDSEEAMELKNILTGNVKECSYTLQPMNPAALESPTITNRITGGNLSLLQASIGTKWQLNPKGKIIFIEEVGERGYRIDRMLEHLRQAGLFDGAEAVLLGDFTEGIEPDGRSLCGEALQRFARSHPALPIFRCEGIGHGAVNHPLPFGTVAVIEKEGDKVTVRCETGVSQ